MTSDVAAPRPTVAADKNRVIIFDTTMRDGEQSPGASMSFDEKLELAKILEEMGVDVIEAGFPIASNGDFEAVREIAKIVTESTVCGLARAGVADIERCAEAIRPARRGRIHTFLSTSPQHRDYILRMSQEEVLNAVTGSVTHARNLCGDVEWSAQDATRTERDFLAPLRRGGDQGRRRPRSTCPTRSATAIPSEYAEMFRDLIEQRAGRRQRWSSPPTATTTWAWPSPTAWPAVQAGARQVELAINGIGERAGNAALEEVVMALRVRGDKLPYPTPASTPSTSPAPAATSRRSPAFRCSSTRPSSARTPSPTRPASTRTAC